MHRSICLELKTASKLMSLRHGFHVFRRTHASDFQRLSKARPSKVVDEIFVIPVDNVTAKIVHKTMKALAHSSILKNVSFPVLSDSLLPEMS